MAQLSGLLGIGVILLLAYGLSNNRKAINWRLVGVGLLLQWLLALFVLKSVVGQAMFEVLSKAISQLLDFSHAGASFVFGPLAIPPSVEKAFDFPGGYIFAFQLVPVIIFVASLVSILYYLNVMQRIIKAMAWVMQRLMGVSGLEALSNMASIFVGNIEAQLLIRPYIAQMTQSQLMASLSGSLACIAGSVLVVYIQMGVNPTYLLTASIMAAPGALVIAKMLYPETDATVLANTQEVDLAETTQSVNIIDAAAHGASDGMKVALQVITMLIAFISLIALLNGFLGEVGRQLAFLGLDFSGIGIELKNLSLQNILSVPFSLIAFLLGVPWHEAFGVGGLLGTKLVVNEFVAYQQMLSLATPLSAKAMAITSVALCGFANFGSVAMQIGGIGEMAPNRKADLAKLGMKALMAGTMASYISAAIVGVLS